MMGRPNSGMMLIFTIGFCAIPAQVILMRELLMVFGGNELFIGLFLAVWMLLTAAGSYLAGFLSLKEAHIPFYALLLIVLPLILLFLPDLTRNLLFEPGIEPGLMTELMGTFILLMPFCMLSGFLFASLAERMVIAGEKKMSGKIYGIESAGSMAGGLLFSFVLVYLYDNFKASGIVSITCCLLVLGGWQNYKRKYLLFIFSIVIMLFGILTFFVGNRFARNYLFPGQQLIENRDTPYGNLAVTRTGQQTNVFENNTLLFSTDNQQSSEEAIHFVLVQHDFPKNILLISGGITGLTNEILKYPSIDTIDYIEIDPLIFEIGKRYTNSLKSDHINLITGDPRIFLHQAKRKYDIVITFFPPPSSFYMNRYYTREFMMLVKSKMNRSGIFSFSLPLTANYLNEGSVDMYSSLYNTSRSVFRWVHIFPGLKSYFVVSDHELSTNICQIIENKSIQTDYVNFYYLDEPDMERRSLSISGQINSKTEINADFVPTAVAAFNKYWLNRFQLSISSFKIAVVVVLLLIFLGMMFVSPLQGGMFAAGFSASSLQLILILAFQIVFGYIFKTIGLFAAIFMMGLALGAILHTRYENHALKINNVEMGSKPISTSQSRRYNQIYLQLSLMAIAFIIPGFIFLAQTIMAWPRLLFLLFLLLTLAISIVTGITFSVLSGNPAARQGGNIRHIYGADMAGASLGALATSLLFIPSVGIKMASCLAGLLNLVVIFNIVFRQKILPGRSKKQYF
jgi:spermidine synthase